MEKNENSSIIHFYNCFIIRNNKCIKEDLWVRNGKIINPEPLFYLEKKSADKKINCDGLLIAPGYLDLQINGGFGENFSDYKVDIVKAVDCVARGIVKHGVTGFCPTLITQPQNNFQRVLPLLKKRPGSKLQGAAVLGCHLEGPFINKEKGGAHPLEHIKSDKINSNDIQNFYGYLDQTAIITIAPELDSGNVIKDLVKKGIVISIGHSMATLSEGEKAVINGSRFITHLFNAMLPFHHRDPGIVGLVTSAPTYFGIIADRIHTHDSAVRIAFRSNPNGLVLITDAISAMGLLPGIHKVGDSLIRITNGRAYIEGTNTLCGSIASMDQCVRNLKNVTGCSIVEAINCATLHPAKVLGIENTRGTLNYDSEADFIILDNELNVLATFIKGELVWKSESFVKSEFENAFKTN